MTRRDLLILTASGGLLALVLFRLLSPAGLPTRKISVEAVEIKSQAIKSGETVTQEASWTPPDDVFVVGWAPDVGAPEARPSLLLMSGPTAIFRIERGSIEGLRTTFLPAGTGYLTRKGETIKLRLQIENSGPDGVSGGARALIYFHPVAWR